MQRVLSYFISLALALFAISCANNAGIDEDSLSSSTTLGTNKQSTIEPNHGPTIIQVDANIKSVRVVNWADNKEIGTINVVDGTIRISSPSYTTVKLYNANITSEEEAYLGTADILASGGEEVLTSQNGAPSLLDKFNLNRYSFIYEESIDHIATPPTGLQNFSNNFLYRSDGNPFCLYFVYSNGSYDNVVGLFYYDSEGQRHDQDLYFFDPKEWKGTENVNSHIPVIKNDPNGLTLTMPKDYLFGFYTYNYNTILYPTKYRPADYPTFYSYKAENTSQEPKCITFTDGDLTFITLEDKKNGDNDINDIVMIMTPEQSLVDEPTKDDIHNSTKEVEDALVIGDEVEKLIHKSVGDVDIEARLREPYPYVRISRPIKAGDNFTIDISQYKDYCEADDFRLVKGADVTELYLADGEDGSVGLLEETVKLFNGYPEFATMEAGSNVLYGSHALKIELRPKKNVTYNQIYELLCQQKKETNHNETQTNLDKPNEPGIVDIPGCSVLWSDNYMDDNYYAWGELEQKTYYCPGTYRWFNSTNTYLKYNENDKKVTLEAADDIATIKLGKGWRLPTLEEVQELINLTNSTDYFDPVSREKTGRYLYLKTDKTKTPILYFMWPDNMGYKGNNGSYATSGNKQSISDIFMWTSSLNNDANPCNLKRQNGASITMTDGSLCKTPEAKAFGTNLSISNRVRALGLHIRPVKDRP